MRLWNKFPFTNFHEVNTDWIISEVKNVLERMDTLEDKTEADLLALAKQIVGIQEDVNGKLNNIDATIAQKAAEEVQRLVEEGRFAELITPALEQLSRDLQEKIDAANTAASNALVNTNKTRYLDTLAGKSILIIGDSNSDESYNGSGKITKHWTSELKKIIQSKASGNNITIVNNSKAGMKMTYAVETLTTINKTSTRYDIIIIMLGTNDYGGMTDYAQFRTDLASVAGLLQPHVTEKGCQVYMVSPPKRSLAQRDVPNHIPLVVYAREIANTCKQWGFHFIDAWCKIPELNVENTESINKWLADGSLHFSDVFAPIYAEWILSYITSEKGDDIGDYYEEYRGICMTPMFSNTNNFEYDATRSSIKVGSKKHFISVNGKLKQGGGNTTGIQPIMNVPAWLVGAGNIAVLDAMWTSYSRGAAVEKAAVFINNPGKTMYADITGNTSTGKTYTITGNVEVSPFSVVDA